MGSRITQQARVQNIFETHTVTCICTVTVRQDLDMLTAVIAHENATGKSCLLGTDCGIVVVLHVDHCLRKCMVMQHLPIELNNTKRSSHHARTHTHSHTHTLLHLNFDLITQQSTIVSVMAHRKTEN